MLAMRNRLLLLAPLLMALLVLAGCGKQGATITGKLVLPATVQLEENDIAKITFLPEEQGLRPSVALVSPSDNSFVAKGPEPERRGVPPGKYKVAVKLLLQPASENAAKREKLFESLNQRYDEKNTPLTYEVTAEPQQAITIDLGTSAVRKD
jgi:hypothetical protein